ncbi:MAG: NADH dehydrogenase [uncultured Thermomicrobiales bacterium]|uniref:NADH:ubiquinone reductase (non-electrogenic) n=1 Tax=uncultured Thermomicrobiales bacterium TaxID=1645740 RepID=A0A6J4UNU8_9BACT|nr:MAG: NADH dehydrogenase [uncultured Thermomicrobiales bacterium]
MIAEDQESGAAAGAVPHVVIVGAGFGGLYAAKALADAPVRVTVVDRRNHHLFQPLLYQVATAVLSPSDIAQPIRSILSGQKNVSVLLGEAREIDLDARAVVLDGERLGYDALVLAAGTSHAYFGHDEWEPFAPGLKSLEDAIEIRRRVLLAFEEAEREKDPVRRKALMTFVVVGGGPTGVELAGAIAEISRFALAEDFDRINPTKARVILLEAADRLLLTFPEKLSKKATAALERLGVEVRFGKPVTEIKPNVVCLGAEEIPAGAILWAAGVKASPLTRSLGAPIDRAGRVLVEKDLSIPGHPEAFVVGDLVSLTDSREKPVPGTAPAAMQEGQWAAANILKSVTGEATLPFHYRDRGNMAIIARGSAVADIKGLRLSGSIAWLAWAIVHVLNLIGYRSRLVVTIHWVWSYLTHQRGARLITNRASPSHTV